MTSYVPRIRRETRPDDRIGKFIEEAGAEASERVNRALQGPPLTEAEMEVLAGAAREPVRLYTKVLVTDLETGEQERFTMVRDGDGDPLSGQLSISSPIGRVLLMEYPGAVVAAKTPGGKRLYRILQVEA
jgi:transcription elongation GreA/GreB family factor